MSAAMRRRDVLKGVAGTLLAAGVEALVEVGAKASEAAHAADLPSLKVLGAQKGIEVGSCYSGTGDGIVRTLLRRHAAIVTPEWCLKPRFLRPDENGPYRFAEADAIREFCKSTSAKMHGHTLFWYGDRIDWADDASLEVVKRAYGRFLADVVRRYPEVPSWDVANEVLADPGPGLLRDDYLLSTHGLEFIAFLFLRTRALAPRAKLVLNDYNLECGETWCTSKRERLIALVDQLIARRVPLDAVGLQSHLSSRHGLAIGETLDICDALEKRGLDVHISELDVNDVAFPDELAARDQKVAEMYGRYLSGLLAHKAVKRLVLWGLSDRDHWLVREQADEGRAVGLGRPALFDQDGRPKPSFFAVADALKAAPRRA